LLADGRSPREVLFFYYSNPVASSVQGREIARVLKDVPLVVSFSPFLDETSRYADLILPDALPLERWEDREFPASSPVAGWGVVQPCIAPAGEARHTGEVLLDLARRLGGHMPAALPWKNFEQVLKHRARGLFESRSGTLCVEPFDQGLVREMEARGWWMPEAASFEEFWGKLLTAGAWSDPSYNVRSLSDYTGNADGKFDLVSRELQDRLAGSGAKAVEWMPHFHSEIDGSPNLAYPLLLNPYRPGKLGAWAHALLPWVIQATEPAEGSPHSAAVELNAADAKASGIRNLDWVWIESAVGKIKARALVSPATAPGVVGMPYTPGNSGGGNWLRSPRANPLDLIAPERDPVTGEAYRFNTRVKVYKA
jgi:anaerobic selenocysteine-containing dehydrogenase